MPRKPLNFRRGLLRMRYEASRLLGDQRRKDLLYVRLLEGFLSRKKAALLYDTVLSLDGPGGLAEVGSWKGKSTTTLALAVRRSGRDEQVHAIDHFRGSEEHREILGEEGTTWPEFQQTIREADVEDLVVPHRMSSVEGAKWLGEHGVQLKFLFLDGAHDERSVRVDLEAFLPRMLPGAYLAFDDARPDGPFPGVYRAYREVLGDSAREVAWGGSILMVQLAG